LAKRRDMGIRKGRKGGGKEGRKRERR